MTLMAINLQEEYNNTNIQGIIDQLEQDLVGLAPVKARIKEIAALLLVQRLICKVFFQFD